MVAANVPPVRPRAEVEEMIRALLWARNSPCDCLEKGPVHNFQCIAGGRMMDSAIDALAWVLRATGTDETCNGHILAEYRKAGGKSG